MPPMKSLFSDTQVEQLTAFVETRSGKSGLLRYAGQLYAKHVVLTVQGWARPTRGFQGAHKPIVPQADVKPPPNQLEEAPNLSQIDRSYWLSANPLPVTEDNLLRGKEVFLQRCVGCHGTKGDGKGPGARSCRRRRPTSPTRTTPAAAATPGRATSTTGSCAAGPAPAWRTSASACRWTTSGAWCCSSRRSRTTRCAKNVIPEPSDYITWQPSKELLAWVKSRQKLSDNVSFSKPRAPTRSCRRRCASSRA